MIAMRRLLPRRRGRDESRLTCGGRGAAVEGLERQRGLGLGGSSSAGSGDDEQPAALAPPRRVQEMTNGRRRLLLL
jgi:hypothetical protein